MAAVYDRWHKTHPKLDDPDPEKNDQPCKCGRGKNKLYPTADHPAPGRSGGMRWQARYVDDEGTSVRRNFAENKGDNPELHAEAFIADIKSNLNADNYTKPALAKLTLQEFATKWHMNRPKGKFKTTKNRDDRLAYIYDMPTDVTANNARRKSAGQAPPIAKHTLTYLAKTPSEIQSWIAWMEDLGLAASTICNICRTLSAIFRAAIDDGIVARDPVKADSVNWPSERRPPVVPWTLAQVVKASNAILEIHPRSANTPYIGSGAGMRQGEVFGFAEEDIDFDEQIIHIKRQVREIDHPDTGERFLVFGLPKGDKPRQVPLSESLEERLRLQIKDYPPVSVTLPWELAAGEPHTAGLLFVGFADKAWFHESFNKRLWHPARVAAGVPATRENGFHSMRHAFASACLSHGVDIRTLAEFLGHSNAAITLRYYANLMPNAAHRTRKALDAFFRGPDKNALEMPSGDHQPPSEDDR